MPAAKPAALKLLNGRGPGKDSAGRPVNEGPKFVRSAPEPPTWLGREAKAEWRRIVPELERLRLLSRVTRSSLTAYCETWEVFVRATKALHAGQLTIEAKQGTLAHPAVGIQRATGAELRKWATEYGLTPASEQKVKTPEAVHVEDDAIL
jgi:P27 family predicted phage terminase small subunit